jgi:acyl-CoA dehydrogenase
VRAEGLFELTPEQQGIRELCRDFAIKEIRPLAAEVDEADHLMHWPLWEKASEVGLTTYMLPERFGGGGVEDVLTSCIVYEELCWGDVGLGQLITSNGFHTLPILLLGTGEQQERWMRRVTGTRPCVTAIAITEPDSGSDAGAMTSTATPVPGGYRLRGQKSWISNGEVAEFIVVFARTGSRAGSGGVSAFVLERDDEGLTVGSAMKKMGQRGMICNELFFDDIFLPDDRRLGPEGQAFRGLMGIFERSRTMIAAGSTGIARAVFEFTSDYARQRQTFGRPIVEHQAIGFRLADMLTRIEAARLLVWQAARMLDTTGHAAIESAMAKVFASETAMFCAWGGVQTLGGWGYSREYPVERWMRDAKLDEIGEGTSEILRLVISRQLAKA